MKQTVLVFSAIAASMLILLQLRRWSYFSDTYQEIWTTVFACLFILIGLFLARYVVRPKSVQTANGTTGSAEEIKMQLEKTGITHREYEVLQLVAQGYSNLEISAKLFISESTVKTHVSNVLLKLDAKRRTQAVQKAKDLRIV